MLGPRRGVPAPAGLPLLLLVLLASPLAVAHSLKKLADSLHDDMERYALLMLDPAGGADTLPSIALPRRITAKSVFIAPAASKPTPAPCEQGYHRDGSGTGTCVRLVKVDTKNTWDLLVQDLNQQFGEPDALPGQSAAEAQQAAEAVQAVAVATQVAAEASPQALEPLHFHIPIESFPEATTLPTTAKMTTDYSTPESTTITSFTEDTPPPSTEPTEPPPVPVEPNAEPVPEPEVILDGGENSPSALSLSMAPVVVAEPETGTEATTTWTNVPPPIPPRRHLAPTTSTTSTTTTTSRPVYSFKSDVASTDVDGADPIINSVSDSPLLAGLKRLSPIIVAELPDWPSPSPSAAAAAAPLDASAVPPRRRPSSSFVRFPGTSAPAPSSKPVVFPTDEDDPPRRLWFPTSSPVNARRLTPTRTHGSHG